jgi:hypothetical protein
VASRISRAEGKAIAFIVSSWHRIADMRQNLDLSGSISPSGKMPVPFRAGRRETIDPMSRWFGH